MRGYSAYFAVYEPDEPDGPETMGNAVHSSKFSINMDEDGDVLLLIQEYSPARGDTIGRFRSLMGTGKFENAVVTGTLFHSWPDHIKPLDDLQGGDGQSVHHAFIEMAP